MSAERLVLPAAYSVTITVDHGGAAVQITDLDTDEITHEQHDLDNIGEALEYVARATA